MLKVYTTKQRIGVIDRLQDEKNVIVRDLFKKETDISLFTGRRATPSPAAQGRAAVGCTLSRMLRARAEGHARPAGGGWADRRHHRRLKIRWAGR